MRSRLEHTESDRSPQQEYDDRAGETLNHANSCRYQIHTWQPLKIAGSGFFICWWIFLAYMVFTSHKEGLVSYIAAYSFLAIPHQFVSHREQVEVLHPGRRLSDAPAQEHVELIAPFPAQPHQGRHIQGLHQGHHGHGGLHPQLKGQRPGGALWICFFHAALHSVLQIRFRWPR